MDTVQELADKIKQLPQDKLVFIDYKGEPMLIHKVFIDEDGDVRIQIYA